MTHDLFYFFRSSGGNFDIVSMCEYDQIGSDNSPLNFPFPAGIIGDSSRAVIRTVISFIRQTPYVHHNGFHLAVVGGTGLEPVTPCV